MTDKTQSHRSCPAGFACRRPIHAACGLQACVRTRLQLCPICSNVHTACQPVTFCSPACVIGTAHKLAPKTKQTPAIVNAATNTPVLVQTTTQAPEPHPALPYPTKPTAGEVLNAGLLSARLTASRAAAAGAHHSKQQRTAHGMHSMPYKQASNQAQQDAVLPPCS